MNQQDKYIPNYADEDVFNGGEGKWKEKERNLTEEYIFNGDEGNWREQYNSKYDEYHFNGGL